jgi:hypothetical protein
LRQTLVVSLVAFVGCAAQQKQQPHEQHVAPAPSQAAPAGVEGSAGGQGAPEHQPEIVQTGKPRHIAYSQALVLYPKGARCAGPNAPETVIGEPDQRNEMKVKNAKLVVYGFRFPEGQLLIRCRADHVEIARTLK